MLYNGLTPKSGSVEQESKSARKTTSSSEGQDSVKLENGFPGQVMKKCMPNSAQATSIRHDSEPGSTQIPDDSNGGHSSKPDSAQASDVPRDTSLMMLTEDRAPIVDPSPVRVTSSNEKQHFEVISETIPTTDLHTREGGATIRVNVEANLTTTAGDSPGEACIQHPPPVSLEVGYFMLGGYGLLGM